MSCCQHMGPSQLRGRRSRIGVALDDGPVDQVVATLADAAHDELVAGDTIDDAEPRRMHARQVEAQPQEPGQVAADVAAEFRARFVASGQLAHRGERGADERRVCWASCGRSTSSTSMSKTASYFGTYAGVRPSVASTSVRVTVRPPERASRSVASSMSRASSTAGAIRSQSAMGTMTPWARR